MHFEFGNKWSSSCVCLFLFRLMSSAQGKAKCAYIDWLMTVKLIFFVVMKEWPEFLNTFGKEVQIVYGLFLVNCYLLHVSRLPFQPASAGERLSNCLNWLELAWQYIAMTRNNLYIISISLLLYSHAPPQQINRIIRKIGQGKAELYFAFYGSIHYSDYSPTSSQSYRFQVI